MAQDSSDDESSEEDTRGVLVDVENSEQEKKVAFGGIAPVLFFTAGSIVCIKLGGFQLQKRSAKIKNIRLMHWVEELI